MSLFTIPLVEWVGYIASFIILVSLLMRSIKRLRLINLGGSVLFTAYGFAIGSYPVMMMNAGIVLINVYYLVQMVKSEDYFDVVPVDKTDEYLRAFLAFYQKEIKRAMGFTQRDLDASDFRFFVLRNMVPAGLFIVNTYDEETLEITLDYATPAYQDFKTGAHVYSRITDLFKSQGYTRFVVFNADAAHAKYLSRMCFEETTLDNQKAFIKNL